MSCAGDDAAAEAGEALELADGEAPGFQLPEGIGALRLFPGLQLGRGFDVEIVPDDLQGGFVRGLGRLVFEAFVFIRLVHVFSKGFGGWVAVADEGEVDGGIVVEIGFIAAPAIFGGGADAGFLGIVQNVAEHGEQIGIGFDRLAQEAALIQMAVPLVFLVVVLGIAQIQVVHHGGDVALRVIHEEMHVIFHQAESVEADFFFAAVFPQAGDEKAAVVRAFEENLLVVSADDHMGISGYTETP